MNYTISSSRLSDIADAIREKLGGVARYSVDQMPAAIRSIIAGGTANLITKNITAEGTYLAVDDNADGYSRVVVDVPGQAPTLQEKMTTENGTVTPDSGYDGLSSVVVAVPAPSPNLQNKTATANGSVTADSGYDGLGTVTVNVSANKGNCMHGSAYPADSLGNNGDLYIRTTSRYRFFRMKISKVRRSGSGCQLSKINLAGYGDEVWEEDEPVVTYIFYPHGTSIWRTDTYHGAASSPLTEVDNLIDCHTETKYATATNPSAPAPIIIVIEMGDDGLLGNATVAWYTSDGSSDCDPVSFSFELSADGNTWFPAGTYTDYNVTVNRESGAISTRLSAPTNKTFVMGVYLKANGTWKLIDGSLYS